MKKKKNKLKNGIKGKNKIRIVDEANMTEEEKKKYNEAKEMEKLAFYARVAPRRNWNYEKIKNYNPNAWTNGRKLWKIV